MSSAPQKVDKSCLSLVGLAAFVLCLLAALVVPIIIELAKAPPEVLVMSAKSPDGQYTASEYSVDLGATGGNTYIKLRRTVEPSSKGDIIAYDNTAYTLASPSWQGNGTLVVGVYDAEQQLLLHRRAWQDVRIVYQKRKLPAE